MAVLQQSSNGGGPITGWPLTTLAPAGQTFAVCLAVKDSMQIQRPSYDDPSIIETKNFTRFLFGLTDGTMIQTGEMTISLHEKSKLFKTLTSWNGTMPFSGFDTETMCGKGATLNIIHKTSQKGREYADISAIMPIMQGMEAQVPDRARFVIPTGDNQNDINLQPTQIQQVAQPIQPVQKFNPQPIQQAPTQVATQVTVDQPQPIPTVQQPVQQPMPVQPQQATMGTQFTGPTPENVPF
tara:strand:+ start:2856 stop:3572 length:717 start_codon:yes stop_codon:yes gene_type:complete